MAELCFAEFAKCLQSAMQPTNDDKEVIELLLGWITDIPSVVDKKGNPVHLAPSLISDLLNRKVDVPKAIKNACTTRKILTDAKKHCEDQVIPYLNPIVSDDMFETMGKAIEADDVIATKKKKELAALLENGKEAEFLGQLLIYVINRENRISNSPVVSEDIPLLAEADYECPICHAPLVEYVKNTPVKKYEVIKIFPKDTSAFASEFALIPRPKRIDSPANKMALCRDHAEEYELEPTAEDYTNLKEIKDRLAAVYSLRVDINDVALEDEIQSVLYGLAGITDNTVLEELPLDALRLDQKILPENHLLKNDEMTRVLRYYKTSPTLTVTDASHYTFFTPRDGGTGAQYKGLVVFDLAMLALTRLPVIAHDSVMLKHIEDDANEKIMELYAETPKRVFIAIDKEGSYTPKAQEIMEAAKVLQLSPGEGALFGRTWNDVEVEQ